MQKLTGSKGGEETKQCAPARVQTSALLRWLDFKAPIYKNNTSLNPQNTRSFMWDFTVSEKYALTSKLIITTYRPYIHNSLDRQSNRTHGLTKVYIEFSYSLAESRLDFY